jgi:hypothetical protein
MSETWCYIKRECELTNVNFHGNELIDEVYGESLSNEEILNKWIDILEI